MSRLLSVRDGQVGRTLRCRLQRMQTLDLLLDIAALVVSGLRLRFAHFLLRLIHVLQGS